MVQVNINGKWVQMEPTPKTILVIRPGAGTFCNKLAYSYLEKNYSVIYVGKTGGEYDKYPHNWETNSFVENQGFHLGGLSQLVKDEVSKRVPEALIVGSRGGQVTIGKVWESIWRGPTIMINAGCLTTNTQIPKEISLLFIIMEHDYFTSVNSPEKVKKLANHPSTILFLKGEKHIPKLHPEFLIYSYLFITGEIKCLPPIPNLEIHQSTSSTVVPDGIDSSPVGAG